MSMAECKQAVLVEKETVHRDCLTGCYDRMTIQHLVDLCFLKSDVRQSHAMFVIDVDNFKRVNDTWGREFGDIVLNDVAAVLRRIFRRSDYIGRIGDDEFLGPAPGCGAGTPVGEKGAGILYGPRHAVFRPWR